MDWCVISQWGRDLHHFLLNVARSRFWSHQGMTLVVASESLEYDCTEDQPSLRAHGEMHLRTPGHPHLLQGAPLGADRQTKGWLPGRERNHLGKADHHGGQGGETLWMTHMIVLQNVCGAMASGLTVKAPTSPLRWVWHTDPVPDSSFQVMQIMGGRGDGSCSWVPVTHLWDLDWVPHPGQTPTVSSIWGDRMGR